MKGFLTVLAILLACAVGSVLLVMIGMPFLGEIPMMLLFGWVSFLGTVIPRIRPSIILILEGIGALLVLLIGAHLFLSWLYTNLQRPTGKMPEDHQWKIRWTFSGMSIFILMFVTSIAMTSLIHQAGWLAYEPWLENSFTFGTVRSEMMALGTALGSYQVDWGYFPVTHGTVTLQEVEFPAAYYEGPRSDRWQNPYYYSSDGHSYVLRSYGENRVLGGGTGKFDDLVYSNGQFIVSDMR
jgi:hypothetical protein